MIATVPGDADALEALLLFYSDSGVSDVIGETPANWFAPAPSTARPSAQRTVAPQLPMAAPASPMIVAAAEAAGNAREIAAAATTLDELRAAMETFDGCVLKKTATRLVFEDGARHARLMLVGEAPGREEDMAGKPFVGRSGQLLDRMLAAIGLDRATAYIANIVPWRPPGNRTPTPQEAAICLPFIHRQIELSKPDIVLCIGGSSAQTLLQISEPITKARGRLSDLTIGSHTMKAMPTLHPAYVLRTPIAKRFVWQDLLTVKKLLAENP